MQAHALRSILLAALPVVAIGCTPTPPVMLAAVGAAPSTTQAQEGWLTVYTPTEPADSDGPAYFAGYRIYLSDGTLFRTIRWNGSVDAVNGEPRRIALSVGTYAVEARTENGPLVRVPVVIESGRLTAVHPQGN